MQEERNYLLTKTFPLLNRIARERNVSIVAVDLRWGINKAEEGENGQVIYTCLNEIDNSHPFFIGLLGTRYGWQPSAIDIESKDFSERYPWIAKDIQQNLSITEIEMQYGALRQETPVFAVFYLKNIGGNNRVLCQDDQNEHLQRLRNQICHQKRYQCKYYNNADDLGRQVEKDFIKLLDSLFPKQQLSLIEKLRLEQSYFIESHSKSYYGRKEQHEQINLFITSSEPVLCVCAPGGIGKSALLANWIKERIKDKNLFYYFVGTTQEENNYKNIFYYFINELKYRYGLETNNTPNNKTDYGKEFGLLLENPQLQNKKIVFVIDGIDQIKDNIFFYLPKTTPNVHFILSANSGTQIEQGLRQDGCKMMDLKPLFEAERMEMAKRYLRYHSKKLEETQLRKIVANSLTENTLVLQTLLDELLVFGVYEKLDERIDYYLSSISLEDFFERLIRRCEEVYGAQMVRMALSLIAISRNGLSETDITQLLAVSQLNWSQFYCALINHFIVKNDLISFSHEYLLKAVEKYYFINLDQKTKLHQLLGNYLLHESELRGKYTNNDFSEIPYQLLMGCEFDKLYHFLLDVHVHDYLLLYNFDHNDWILYWKSLYSHDPQKYSVKALLNVVGNDAIRLIELSNLTYKHLTSIGDSKLFAQKAVELTGGKGPVGELAEQILVRILSDKGEVDEAIRHLKLLMTNTWNEMMYDSYEKIMGELLVKKGSYSEARNWFSKVIERNENKGIKPPFLGGAYADTGLCFMMEQSYDDSIRYLLKALKLYKQSIGEENNSVINVLGLLAMAYLKKSDFDQSLVYYKQQLEMGIHLFGVDSESVKKTCLEIANVYDKIGDHQRKEYYLAKSFMGKSMSFLERFNDLEQRALTYKQKGEYQYAINLFKEYIFASENLGDVFASNRARIFAHIAFCYEKLKNNVQMLENWSFSSKEADKVKLSSLKSEERTNSSICNIYYNYGIFLYQNQQFYDSSVQLLKCIKALNDTQISVEYYNNLLMTLWNSYRFLCENCRAKSNYVDAQLWVDRMRDLCQQNNWEKTPEMGNVFAQQAMIHQGMGNFQFAIENMNEAIRLYKQSSDKFPLMLGSLYEYLGNIYRNKQSLSDAIVCYNESAAYYEKVSDTSKLVFVYNEIGMAKGRQGNFRDALIYHNKALELAKLLYNNDCDPRLAALYYNVGYTLIETGNKKRGDEYIQFAKYISNNE
ncbi:MAG: tetratricopeptide repeat protein [Bacteroidales bacterium]|nr:tetratricopeptide repeat protein [Bacteroidales bacterium]